MFWKMFSSYLALKIICCSSTTFTRIVYIILNIIILKNMFNPMFSIKKKILIKPMINTCFKTLVLLNFFMVTHKAPMRYLFVLTIIKTLIEHDFTISHHILKVYSCKYM